MKSDIRIYNIGIENKYYDYDYDDPRYDVNDKIKSINKEYIYNNIDLNVFNYLEDCLQEIGQNYCDNLLDTTLDDIIIYCDIIIINNFKTQYNRISYNYSETNSIKIIK